jgi:hypothetical protein
MISREEAIEAARQECQRRGWKDAPPYTADSGRDYVLWGRKTWFVVTNAESKGDNAYINIDADSGEVIGAGFASMEARRAKRPFNGWW